MAFAIILALIAYIIVREEKSRSDKGRKGQTLFISASPTNPPRDSLPACSRLCIYFLQVLMVRTWAFSLYFYIYKQEKKHQ